MQNYLSCKSNIAKLLLESDCLIFNSKDPETLIEGNFRMQSIPFEQSKSKKIVLRQILLQEFLLNGWVQILRNILKKK